MQANNFRNPMPGETVPMVCSNCGYHGGGMLPKRTIFNKGQVIKCPKCNKKAFSRDHRFKY